MLKSTVYSLGNPGTFDISDKDDPQYYLARYAHEMSKNLYDLNQAGFEWRQETQADFGAIETEFDGFMGDVTTWLDSAVAASMAETTIPALPAMPNLHPTYEAADGGVSVWWLIIKFCLWYVLLKIKKSLEGDSDTTEVANVLRKALLRENESEEEYSLLELLSQVPIQILFSRGGSFQDIVLSSQPPS